MDTKKKEEKKPKYTVKSTFSGDLYVEPEEVILDESFQEKLDAIERIRELQEAS